MVIWLRSADSNNAQIGTKESSSRSGIVWLRLGQVRLFPGTKEMPAIDMDNNLTQYTKQYLT